MDRNRLLKAHVELRAYVLAQEDWHPNYRTSPKAFRMLTRAEALIQSNVREYLRGLRGRIGKLIDWNEVYRRMSMGDVTVTITDASWETETQMLFQALLDPITAATVAGSMVAQANLGIDVGFGAGNATVLRAARERTASLIKGLNSTTKDQISQAIQHGLAQHEDIQQITDRVAEFVDSGRRAETIARTEAVRAATQGQLLLGGEIGTQFKVWEDGQPGECELCMSIRPKRIPLAEPFNDGSDGPPRHPGCKCGMSLDFATPEEAASLADGTWEPPEV